MCVCVYVCSCMCVCVGVRACVVCVGMCVYESLCGIDDERIYI